MYTICDLIEESISLLFGEAWYKLNVSVAVCIRNETLFTFKNFSHKSQIQLTLIDIMHTLHSNECRATNLEHIVCVFVVYQTTFFQIVRNCIFHEVELNQAISYC